MSRLKLETKKNDTVKVPSRPCSPISTLQRKVFTKTIPNLRPKESPKNKDPESARTKIQKILPKSSISSQAGGDKTRQKPGSNSPQEKEYHTKLKLQIFTKLRSPASGHKGKRKLVGKIVKEIVPIEKSTSKVEELVTDCLPRIPPIAILLASPTNSFNSNVCPPQKIPFTKKNPASSVTLEEHKRKIEEKFLSKSFLQKVNQVKAVPCPTAFNNKKAKHEAVVNSCRIRKNDINNKKKSPIKPKLKPLPVDTRKNIDEKTRKAREKQQQLKDKYSPRVKEIWRAQLTNVKRNSAPRSSSSRARPRRHSGQKNPQPHKEEVKKDDKDETVKEILTEAHRMIWSWFFNGLVPGNKSQAQEKSVSNETKINQE